jgi:hypothetical protein
MGPYQILYFFLISFIYNHIFNFIYKQNIIVCLNRPCMGTINLPINPSYKKKRKNYTVDKQKALQGCDIFRLSSFKQYFTPDLISQPRQSHYMLHSCLRLAVNFVIPGLYLAGISISSLRVLLLRTHL